MNNSNVIDDLYKLIIERKNSQNNNDNNDNSYTCYLFKEGLNKILKKIGEESSETIIAAKDAKANNGGKELVIGEVADLIYHLLVMLADLDISFEEVEDELKKRSEKMGNLKQQKVVDKNT